MPGIGLVTAASFVAEIGDIKRFANADKLAILKSHRKVKGLTGKNSDFTAVNKAVGLKSTPAGHTWHHVEDGKSMQLVPTDLHSAVKHTGGAALLRKGLVPK